MMEHEQVNDRAVAMSIQSTKLTGRMLAKAMQAFLKKVREPKYKHGEQSLKSLTKQGASLADIEISGDNIGSFRKIARKYSIDFALKQDKSAIPPRWVVFFKAKDDKSLDAAFKEYSQAELKQKKRKPSMLSRLARSKAKSKSAPERTKEKAQKHTRGGPTL